MRRQSSGQGREGLNLRSDRRMQKVAQGRSQTESSPGGESSMSKQRQVPDRLMRLSDFEVDFSWVQGTTKDGIQNTVR